jgi:hypothetical protein
MDKNHISTQQFIEGVAYLLRETFEGSPEGQMSAFLDRGIGVFSTLEKLSAEEASRKISSMTVAAQTEHAKFYLDRLCEFLKGRTDRVNWDDSWLIETVNENEWSGLQQSARASYENTMQTLRSLEELNEMQIGMAMSLVAHTAYHLGAIRQIAKAAQDQP